MRKVLIVLLSLSLFVSCEKEHSKVLLFVTDGSRDLELMLTREVLAMKDLLEKSNLEVDIATLTGERISVDTVVVIPDFKLVNVNVSEYEGYMFPCMAPPWDKIYEPNNEVVSFIKEAYQEGKPMASQTLSVADFAKAGILVNRKYAFTIDPDLDEYPEFQGGIYSGEGVIQDGLIITSGTCPWKTREYGKPDGTPKLTELFIQAVTAKQ
jgi:putative intracellular protease/amidase